MRVRKRLSLTVNVLKTLTGRYNRWSKGIKKLSSIDTKIGYFVQLTQNGKEYKKVDEAREKTINDIVKLPIIMKLLIKNKGNKASEYCFNKKFLYHSSQHTEHVSTQSAADNTMSTQVKKQNRKNLMKKQN